MNVCVCCSNLKAISGLLINASNVENLTLKEYEDWYWSEGKYLKIPEYNITACSLEVELKQVCKVDIMWNDIFR